MFPLCVFRGDLYCTAIEGCVRCCWFASNTCVSGDGRVCRHRLSKTCAGRHTSNFLQASNPKLFFYLMRKNPHRNFLVQTKDCPPSDKYKCIFNPACPALCALSSVQRFVHCCMSSASFTTTHPAFHALPYVQRLVRCLTGDLSLIIHTHVARLACTSWTRFHTDFGSRCIQT